MSRAPYHRVQALLGRGDLHPGGAAASARLIGWIAETAPRRVLEIGAGAGLSTRRLRERGWDVTALEPDSVLASRLRAMTGVHVLEGRVESLGLDTYPALFDAVLAESVLYGTSLPTALRQIHDALRPGGVLALSEMVWAPGTSASLAEQTHDESKRRYGIAGVSRAPWGWADWRRMLNDAGFELLREERIGEGSPGGASASGWLAAVRGLLAQPGLIVDVVRFRRQIRDEGLNNRHFESWIALARSLPPQGQSPPAPPP